MFARRAAAVVAAIFVFCARPSAAQRPVPTQSQIDAALKDSAMAARVQRELAASGMSSAEIKAQLRANGLPEDALDAVLPGQRLDSTTRVSNDALAAVQALGLLAPTVLDSLRPARSSAAAKAIADSMFMDSLSFAMRDPGAREAVRTFLRNRAMGRGGASDSGFTIFGRNIFRAGSEEFQPILTGPVDPSYRIGVGDRIVLTLTGDVERSYPLTVNQEGYVVIPGVPAAIYVANLTKGEMDRLVFSRLSRVYSGLREGPNATTHLVLSVSSLGVKDVIVTGFALRPERYRVPNSGTAFTALYQAGGPAETGSMRRIEIRRGGRTVGTLDVYDYLLSGSTADDIRLESGDIVFVGARGPRVRIAGAVMRPATYEIRPGETLRDVVAMAGGLLPTADRRRIEIERVVPAAQRTKSGEDRKVFDITDPSTTEPGGPSIALEPDDIIRVREISTVVAGFVTVTGTGVWSGGRVSLTPGMKLSDALKRAGGLKSDSYLDAVQISRLQPDSSRRLINAALRDTLGNAVDDVTLSNLDVIEVFSKTTFRPTRYVVIEGAVNHSGQYPYKEGMTARDLAMLAGGLREGALLTEAELSRMPVDRRNGTIATVRRFAIDSGYLFERRADGTVVGPPGLPGGVGRAPDMVLDAYDHVLILFQPQWSYPATVAIQGQVLYPGPYTLTKTTERLRNVIERAGGMTPDAYQNGIVFVRKHNNVGRIGVDLPKVMRDSTHIDNLPLMDGDSVFIPTFSGVVTIRGAVASPLGVPFVSGKDLDYYIRAAGGSTEQGDRRRAYVLQPNGKVESRRTFFPFESTPEPQPGGIVVVPSKDTSLRRDWASMASAGLSILGSLVAIAAIVK